MWFIKMNRDFMEEHFRKDMEGFWFCKKTNASLQVAKLRVSILHPDFSPNVMTGTVETREITHVACIRCFPGSTPPVSGHQVYESELISI